jgi:hypothetical protein
MRADTAELGSKSSHRGRVIPVEKLRLASLDRLDHRTLPARRARRLAKDFAAALGDGLSAAQKAACENAAVLVVLAEDTASRRLGGDLDVSLEDVVRLERVAQLALRRLGIERQRRSPAKENAFAGLVLPDEIGP